MAVDRVEKRLRRVTAALDEAGIKYAVIGGNAVASKVNATAVGFGAVASADPTAAFGANSTASGNDSTALGADATAAMVSPVGMATGSCTAWRIPRVGSCPWWIALRRSLRAGGAGSRAPPRL